MGLRLWAFHTDRNCHFKAFGMLSLSCRIQQSNMKKMGHQGEKMPLKLSFRVHTEMAQDGQSIIVTEATTFAIWHRTPRSQIVPTSCQEKECKCPETEVFSTESPLNTSHPFSHRTLQRQHISMSMCVCTARHFSDTSSIVLCKIPKVSIKVPHCFQHNRQVSSVVTA